VSDWHFWYWTTLNGYFEESIKESKELTNLLVPSSSIDLIDDEQKDDIQLFKFGDSLMSTIKETIGTQLTRDGGNT
jgi:hypothetical protein